MSIRAIAQQFHHSRRKVRETLASPEPQPYTRTQEADAAKLEPFKPDPGQRLELSFGHIYADFPEGRRQVPVLIPTWSFSNFAFAIGLPTERIEAILAGMVAAFEFFGCVAREGWWDNPKTVALGILRGRERQMNSRYAALANHYDFEPLFCMPATPTEKPAVEHKVYDLQRRWCTPVPQVRDHEDL